jgi:hypothetical protein
MSRRAGPVAVPDGVQAEVFDRRGLMVPQSRTRAMAPPDPLGLGRPPGSVFVSPSLRGPNPANVVDVASVELSSAAYDSYTAHADHDPPQQRPFLMGPPPAVADPRPYPPNVSAPDYVPVPNAQFTLLGTTQRTAAGAMFDSLTSTTTFIFY